LQHLAARIFTKEQMGIAESRCLTKTFVGDPSRSARTLRNQPVMFTNRSIRASEVQGLFPSARQHEGTTSFHTKTTTELRIGATEYCRGGVGQKSTFARFSASFDFRLLQHYRGESGLPSCTPGLPNLDPKRTRWFAKLAKWATGIRPSASIADRTAAG
jgi:hypothetical protein